MIHYRIILCTAWCVIDEVSCFVPHPGLFVQLLSPLLELLLACRLRQVLCVNRSLYYVNYVAEMLWPTYGIALVCHRRERASGCSSGVLVVELVGGCRRV